MPIIIAIVLIILLLIVRSLINSITRGLSSLMKNIIKFLVIIAPIFACFWFPPLLIPIAIYWLVVGIKKLWSKRKKAR